MSNRTRRPHKRIPAKRSPGNCTPPASQSRTWPDKPDLVKEVAAALADDEPLTLLSLVSSLLAVLDPQPCSPFEPTPEPGVVTRDELVRTFLEVDLLEISAMLVVTGELTGDDLLRRRVRRKIATQGHALPGWLLGLRKATVEGVVEMAHVLGDGDNVMIGVRLPDGYALSFVVYIDHNMGTLVKDAFVVPEPLDALIEHMYRAVKDDPDTTWADVTPADARVRIRDALDRGAITFPAWETETWPACRPLVEWVVSLLPIGGTGYQRPHWDDDALVELTERFLGSPFGADLDDADHQGLLGSLLWFGTDYGPGDPLRWSPVSVEILLVDWIPRKIVAEVAYLTKIPDLLRAFIRFCHHERGIRPAPTADTLAAVDRYEPQYQQTIRSPRPQVLLDGLRRAVGGEDALDRLDAVPLPDEPFAWGPIPVDIHHRVTEVLTLVEQCCDELLDREYRTACRRYLARAAAGDPDIFRHRNRTETAAASICWVIGKANDLFATQMLAKDLTGHFGVGQGSASQRSETFLRAIGVDPHDQYGNMYLGSPDYLTSARREQILALRDCYRDMDGSTTASQP